MPTPGNIYEGPGNKPKLPIICKGDKFQILMILVSTSCAMWSKWKKWDKWERMSSQKKSFLPPSTARDREN